jgi:hypothetical protein
MSPTHTTSLGTRGCYRQTFVNHIGQQVVISGDAARTASAWVFNTACLTFCSLSLP